METYSQLLSVKNALQLLADSRKAKILQKFFKTAPGEYGAGDIFWGVTVPEQRKIAKRYYKDMPIAEIAELLASPVHEERLTALLIMNYKYCQADALEQQQLVSFYLQQISRINNWDLVDLSAPNILGAWLVDKDRSVLYTLAHQDHIWSKRIAIVATLTLIRRELFTDSLALVELFLSETHPLLHKASGWMLREIGKRQESVLLNFLQKFAAVMPRIMLRYAIERLDPIKKKNFLNMKRC